MISLFVETLWQNINTISLLVLVYYFLKVYFGRRQLVKHANNLPSLKLKTRHLLGHLDLVLYQRLFARKLKLSPHVYDFMALNGYNVLHSKENITNIWQIHLPLVSVYKADSVEMILNHSTELRKAFIYDFLRPWLGTGLLTSYDEKWKRRRKMLTPAFHFNILKDFLPAFNKQARILMDIFDKFVQDEFVNIVPIISRCSLDIICESILGKEIHTQTQSSSPYATAIQELTASTFERMQRPWLWNEFLFKISAFGRRFFENVATVNNFTNMLISEKKACLLERKSSQDLTISQDVPSKEGGFKRKKLALMDLLLDQMLENNSITEEDIKEEINTFAFEGHDTTSIAVSWSLYLIGLHPWIQDKIHEELDSIFDEDDHDTTIDDLKNMKYLECVIKEVIRLYPPVPTYARMIREDIKFQGRIVPAGSTCVVHAYLLHRDPNVFPNPEKFDPERFTPENSTGRHPFAYVPFSAGPRNCIGQRFALMEAKTVLSFILRRYKLRSLDPRDKIHLLDELVLRPTEGLRLQIRRRNQDFDFHSVYYYP